MSPMIRPLAVALALTLAASLGCSGSARAGYTYTASINPFSISGGNGSFIELNAAGGSGSINGVYSLHSLVFFTGGSNGTATIGATSFTETLTFSDTNGPQTGTFSIMGTISATFDSNGFASISGTNLSQSSSSIMINGDMYTLSNLGVNVNGGPGPNVGADITATPSSVPEPSSLVLMGLGLGGTALVLARRFRSGRGRPTA